MNTKEELTQIVKEVQKDKRQFELLYSQIVNRVYFWCYTMLNNDAEAKDVTQEVMIRIYNKIDTLKNPENIISWVYRLSRNYCLNHLRDNKKNELEFLYDEETGENTEYLIKENRKDSIPHKAYDLNETKEVIKKFIDTLPMKQKEVIVLYYLEELTVEEVATLLDRSVGTIKSRLYNGRKGIEKQIQLYEQENHIKLYSSSLLTILGLILLEFRDEVCENQDLHFNKESYTSSKLSSVKKIINFASKHMLINVVAAVAICATLYLVFQSQSDTTITKEEGNNLLSDDVDVVMFNKANSNPYVESINYYTFPEREALDIVVVLEEELDKNDIQILYDNEKMSFEKENDILNLQVNENGKYTILINNKSISFEINNIDPYAPELIEVHNTGNYLQLFLKDELQKIDYDLSYIEYKGEKYSINNLKVKGRFIGEVAVVIHIDENCYKKYFVDIKEIYRNN